MFDAALLDMNSTAGVLPLIAAGAGVGFLIGLTGVAGAALMTPLLISTFGVNPEVAVGTDLLYASITKIAAVWRHYLEKHIVWRLVLALAMGSIPAALALIVVLALVPVDTASLAHSIRLGLGFVLPASALAILVRPFMLRGRSEDSNERSRARIFETMSLGALLGFTVTLTSVGAGAIGVPVLAMLYPMLAAKRVVGTDIAHAAGLAFVAGLGHAGLGHVDFGLLLPLLLGSIPGMLVGSSLCDRAPDWLLRPILAVTLCYAAYTLFN
jgi:uncharacterized protein